MAKRYTVTSQHLIGTEGGSTTTAYVDAQVDLSVLLSQRLQKNLRQGRTYHIHKIRASLSPVGGQDLDTGIAVSGTISYAPVTKNTRKAWNMAFNTWRAQKRLRQNAVGLGIRYDDFEVAYESAYVNSRTSSMFTTGLGDTTSEDVCIYGSSTSNDDVTLEDIFESAQTLPQASFYPLGGEVKASKYTQEFPDRQRVGFGATYSSIAPSGNMILEPDTGAIFLADPVYIQDTSCLCGVVRVQAWAIPEDIVGYTGDELYLNMEYTVSIGSSLVYTKPKPKFKKKMTGGRKVARKPRRRYSKK
jgi:hypothetical protein